MCHLLVLVKFTAPGEQVSTTATSDTEALGSRLRPLVVCQVCLFHIFSVTVLLIARKELITPVHISQVLLRYPLRPNLMLHSWQQ